MKKISRKQFLQLAGVSAAALSLAACGGSSASTAASGSAAASTTASDGPADKTVTIATVTMWDTLNPIDHTQTDTDWVLENIYDRLILINGDGTWSPRLAESWEYNDEQTVFTLHIDPKAAWHDGEPVTANDVAYTFRLCSSAEKAWLRQSINCKYYLGTDENGCEESEDSIQVVATDDYTVEFRLKEPADPISFFCRSLKDVFILPEHILGQHSDAEVADLDFWDAPIGSGPFKYVSQVDGESIEMTANENYHLGCPKFKTLVYKKMDQAAIAAAMLSGDVDMTMSLSAMDIDTVQTSSDIVVESAPNYSYQSMVCNVYDPLLTRDVRVAIDKAIDKQAIVDQIYFGYAEALVSTFPSNAPYYDSNLPATTYDPDGAKQLLEGAGWDSSNVLEMQVASGSDSNMTKALMIQQDLEKVGIKTEIVTYDFATVLSNMRALQFQLLFMGSAAAIEPSASTSGILFFTQSDDEHLNDLIKQGTQSVVFEERKKIYDEIQEYCLDQGYLSNLYSPYYVVVYNSRLSNIPVKTTDIYNGRQIWTWDVA